jgi:Family of unknown function (DUF5985)
LRTGVYLLSFGANLACAFLLLRAYRRVMQKLLLWCGLCFAGLALSSAMVFVDLVLLPTVDLFPVRLGLGILAMALMIYGLIFEEL